MDVKIIESLGLKPDEHFKISGSGNKIFWMNKNGFFYFYENDEKQQALEGCYDTLGLIILHPELIIKSHWKPQLERKYWSVVYSSGDLRPVTVSSYWAGNNRDLLDYHIGNCFETKEEAEAFIPTFMAWRKKTRDKVSNVWI